MAVREVSCAWARLRRGRKNKPQRTRRTWRQKSSPHEVLQNPTSRAKDAREMGHPAAGKRRNLSTIHACEGKLPSRQPAGRRRYGRLGIHLHGKR